MSGVIRLSAPNEADFPAQGNSATGATYVELLSSGGSSISSKTVTTLLNAVITNQTSAAYAFGTGRRTFQASIAGTGAVSGTVTWYGNNANAASGGVLLATMTLSGTGSDTAGSDIPAEWPYIYCVLASITGTDAAVTAKVGL